MAENLKQLNMRIPEDIKTRFDQMVKESGLTQVEYFAQMMAQIETDELKTMVPDAADEIDTFDAKLTGLRELYIGAVKRSQEAYEVASHKVKSQLEQLTALMEENQQLKALKDENERLEKELTEAQAKAAEAEGLRKQLTEAREQLLKLREQHADELEKAKGESFRQLLELVKAQQGK